METTLPVVSLTIDELEVVRAAINSAYMASMAHDLEAQYRKLSNRQQYSALTKALDGALGIIDTRISEAAKEGDKDEQPS